MKGYLSWLGLGHAFQFKWITQCESTPFSQLHIFVENKVFHSFFAANLAGQPTPPHPTTTHVISACLVTVARYEAVKSHQSDLTWHLTIWHLWLFSVSFKIELLVMVWWAVSSGITSHRQTQIGRIHQFDSCGDMEAWGNKYIQKQTLHVSCSAYAMLETPHWMWQSCRLCATGQKRSARWRRLMSGGVTFPGHMSVISGLRATQERRHRGAMSAAHSDSPSRDGWESEWRADGTGLSVST